MHIPYNDVEHMENGIIRVGKTKHLATDIGDAILREYGPSVYQYEYTDLYGEERNYSWVRRGYVIARDSKHAMRLARKALGLTGVKGGRFDIEESWRPRGTCMVLDVEIVEW